MHGLDQFVSPRRKARDLCDDAVHLSVCSFVRSSVRRLCCIAAALPPRVSHMFSLRETPSPVKFMVAAGAYCGVHKRDILVTVKAKLKKNYVLTSPCFKSGVRIPRIYYIPSKITLLFQNIGFCNARNTVRTLISLKYCNKYLENRRNLGRKLCKKWGLPYRKPKLTQFATVT